MKALEMKIAVPEVNGERCIPAKMKDGHALAKLEIGENKTSSITESELECRIDPNTFAGAWIEEYEPTSGKQLMTLNLYQDAKEKCRLHVFTCMTIDPSIKDGKLVYKKGLPIIAKFPYKQWEKMMKDYNPSRNSRAMTRTEFACRNLFIIQRLVESGYEIAEAWKAVCDDSKMIGHYYNFNFGCNDHQNDYEPTGSSEVCGFCDLGNAWKFIAEDPWEEYPWNETPSPYGEGTGFWCVGGYCKYSASLGPVADMWHFLYTYYNRELNGVGMIALD